SASGKPGRLCPTNSEQKSEIRPQGRTSNIEHRTSNIERVSAGPFESEKAASDEMPAILAAASRVDSSGSPVPLSAFAPPTVFVDIRLGIEPGHEIHRSRHEHHKTADPK